MKHLLTADEECDLARRVGQGDWEARNTLIERNLGLVGSLARRYTVPGVETADLIQEGILGLVHAIEKFDPSHGCRFSTYAIWWIRRHIARAVLRETHSIRLPLHVAEEIRRIGRATDVLRQRLEREPNAVEVAAVLDRPVEKVESIMRLSDELLSLDAPVPNTTRTLQDCTPTAMYERAESMATRLVRCDEIERLLSRLSSRQQVVIRLRYGLDGGTPCTPEEVGERFCITGDNARQIERRALRKMQQTGIGR